MANNPFVNVKNLLFQLIALYIPGSTTLRVWLHRMRGVTIGKDVFIGISTLLETSKPKLIYLGNNVAITMRCLLVAHSINDKSKNVKNNYSIRIEDNAYIGPGVIILPQVTIGEGSVVAAGSVVNRSIPPRTFVKGNPAKPIAKCGVPLIYNKKDMTVEIFKKNLKPLDES